MKRISINYTIIISAVVLFALIVFFYAEDNGSGSSVPVYSAGQTINIGDFIILISKPEEGYRKENTLVKITVRNLTDNPIAVTSYLTGNTAEDIYNHYYLFLEQNGKIYEIEGEFIKVNPTDGTTKYDAFGNLYFDIPVSEINQYTYLLITSDKKAEDVICKIKLN
ncbi:hypothetical protein ASZ90_004595 [hydrocarbon metagenome]|uniref:DUF4352 domain-containing protein n=1 Tax=hydrocarbon metagenome TaxID=938273 RepID=A0A0W8FXS6_9ZZZZ